MRIAITTQLVRSPDGSMVEQLCGHAGRCRRFTIVEARDGELSREVIELAEAETFHHRHELPAALGRLDVLISRTMGEGLFTTLEALGVTPFITVAPTIDQAVELVLRGEVVSAAPHATRRRS
jgi:predicted Fe-Mo cluster-binding NifX family protein